jgi:hypothetical protein
MPSSSVSDGVQSLITELYPQGIFLPIETNGDGAVNVYSRVQMQLFKAKQHAQREVDEALKASGMTIEEVRAWLAKHPRINGPFFKAPHHVGSTTADLIYEVAARRKALRYWKNRAVEAVTRKAAKAEHATHERLLDVARRVGEKMKNKKGIVSVAPEAPVGDERTPIPAGRKSLKVVN